MEAYTKLFVAIGGLVVLLGTRYGVDLNAEVKAGIDIVTALLTVFLVYQLPNKPKEGA